MPNLRAPRCRNCGEILLDLAATEKITQAIRRQAELLTPEPTRQESVNPVPERKDPLLRGAQNA